MLTTSIKDAKIHASVSGGKFIQNCMLVDMKVVKRRDFEESYLTQKDVIEYLEVPEIDRSNRIDIYEFYDKHLMHELTRALVANVTMYSIAGKDIKCTKPFSDNYNEDVRELRTLMLRDKEIAAAINMLNDTEIDLSKFDDEIKVFLERFKIDEKQIPLLYITNYTVIIQSLPNIKNKYLDEGHPLLLTNETKQTVAGIKHPITGPTILISNDDLYLITQARGGVNYTIRKVTEKDL